MRLIKFWQWFGSSQTRRHCGKLHCYLDNSISAQRLTKCYQFLNKYNRIVSPPLFSSICRAISFSTTTPLLLWNDTAQTTEHTHTHCVLVLCVCVYTSIFPVCLCVFEWMDEVFTTGGCQTCIYSTRHFATFTEWYYVVAMCTGRVCFVCDV